MPIAISFAGCRKLNGSYSRPNGAMAYFAPIQPLLGFLSLGLLLYALRLRLGSERSCPADQPEALILEKE